MTPDGYALALAFLEGEAGRALPLAHRAALLGFLARFEPHPQAVQEAAVKGHLSGLMAHNRLTPDGVRAALEALEGALTPPRSTGGPRTRAGRRTA